MKKLIVITGVSRGLGQAITEGFIQLGNTVLGCARSKNTVEKLQEKFRHPHNFTVVDVAEAEQVQIWGKTLNC